MDFRSQAYTPDTLSELVTDALVLVVASEALPASLDVNVAAVIDEAIKAGDFEVKAGRSLYIQAPAGLKARRLVLVAAPELALKGWSRAVQMAVGMLKAGGSKQLALAAVGTEPGESHAERFVLAISDALYTYRHTKPSAPKPAALAKATLLAAKPELKAVQRGLERGLGIEAGVTLAREWANRPGNHCRPRDLGDEAKRMGRAHGLKVQVLDAKGIEELGMHSFLSVAKGSEEPPRFIVMRYEGAAKSSAPVVLVGKGITFDTGGISIKPAAEMDEMKFDMGGAASVLGAMRAIAEIAPKLNVIALIPTCENMPDGKAVKPGDVVTTMSGQTVEILNTDAEGRLILCDALTYAERFKPAAVVDIATLTGACVIALGHHYTGMFSPDESLAADLLAAGQAALDPCWRMPLDDDYDDALKSNFADVANVGGRAGGAITAAMFLKRFAAKYRWAHLDIAGTAWKSGAAKGSTGRPVPLLVHFVLSQVR